VKKINSISSARNIKVYENGRDGIIVVQNITKRVSEEFAVSIRRSK